MIPAAEVQMGWFMITKPSDDAAFLARCRVTAEEDYKLPDIVHHEGSPCRSGVEEGTEAYDLGAEE